MREDSEASEIIQFVSDRLAECPADDPVAAVHRRLLDQHTGYYGDLAAPVQVPRLLALLYDQHPDYRQEWRPL